MDRLTVGQNMTTEGKGSCRERERESRTTIVTYALVAKNKLLDQV